MTGGRAHDDRRIGVAIELSDGIEVASLLAVLPAGADAAFDALVPDGDVVRDALDDVDPDATAERTARAGSR